MIKDGFDIRGTLLYKYDGPGGDIVIPDGIMVIGESAFSQCSGLTSVKFPDSVAIIGYDAFHACRNLRSVDFGKKLVVISYGAFSDCEKLVSAVIPESTVSIRDYGFYGCVGLKSFTVGNSTAEIGNGVLSRCPALTSLRIRDIVLNKKTIKSFRRYCKRYDSVSFSKIINTIITNKYDFLPKEVIYSVLCQLFFLCPENKEISDYFNANRVACIFYMIDEEETELLQKALSFSEIVTEEIIDKCIQFAIEKKKHEMQIMLTDYKYRHFDFWNPADRLML